MVTVRKRDVIEVDQSIGQRTEKERNKLHLFATEKRMMHATIPRPPLLTSKLDGVMAAAAHCKSVRSKPPTVGSTTTHSTQQRSEMKNENRKRKKSVRIFIYAREVPNPNAEMCVCTYAPCSYFPCSMPPTYAKSLYFIRESCFAAALIDLLPHA